MKKFIALMLALTAVLPLAACTREQEEEADWILRPSDMKLAAKSDTEPESTPDETAPTTYETEDIQVFGYSKLHQGNIDALYGSDAWILVTKDHKAFNSPYSPDHKRIAPDAEIEKAYVRGNDTIYECNDGYTYINYIPCTGIKGEILCTLGNGALDVISFADGHLYYNRVATSGKLLSQQNEPLYLRDYVTREQIHTIDSIEVRLCNNNLYFLVRSGDRTFFGNVFMLLTGVDKMKYNTLYELKNAYSKILDFGYFDSYASPLYAVSEDADRLCYTIGYTAEDEYCIHLPEGYTAADIEEAIFNDTVLVRFKDGKVFMNDLTTTIAGTKLHLCEPISALSEAGHVEKMFLQGNGDILLLCDDGLIYVYEN